MCAKNDTKARYSKGQGDESLAPVGYVRTKEGLVVPEKSMTYSDSEVVANEEVKRDWGDAAKATLIAAVIGAICALSITVINIVYSPTSNTSATPHQNQTVTPSDIDTEFLKERNSIHQDDSLSPKEKSQRLKALDSLLERLRSESANSSGGTSAFGAGGEGDVVSGGAIRSGGGISASGASGDGGVVSGVGARRSGGVSASVASSGGSGDVSNSIAGLRASAVSELEKLILGNNLDAAGLLALLYQEKVTLSYEEIRILDSNISDERRLLLLSNREDFVFDYNFVAESVITSLVKDSALVQQTETRTYTVKEFVSIVWESSEQSLMSILVSLPLVYLLLFIFISLLRENRNKDVLVA